MRHRELSVPPALAPVPVTIEAQDGVRLGARVYRPAGRTHGTVLIHGATAAPQRYYERFAGYLAGRGVRVVTYDYRGVGASRAGALDRVEATMTGWARLDAHALHRFVRARHGDEPLVVLGHSFGGQLFGLIDDVRDAAGAVLVASQLGWVGHWPLASRLKLELLWRAVLPTLTATTGYLPGWAGLGEDLPAGVAREWARWCLSPGYLTDFHRDARVRFARFDRPTLLYSFSDDDYAPPRAVGALVEALGGAALDHRALTPLDVGAPVGHFGFFRPRHAQGLWREAGEWIDAILRGEAPPTARRVGLVTEAELAEDLHVG